MRYFILSIALLFITSIFLTGKVFADSGCQPIYGGGETCTTNALSIDKTVFNPQSTNPNDQNAFVDNLGANDPKYRATFNVTFHIKVTNTSPQILSNVRVNDIFPDLVNFAADFSQNPGNFDKSSNTWSATIPTLQPNTSITYVLVGKVVSEEQLPSDKAVTCVTNRASATTSDNKSVQDSAQLCIQRAETVITPTTKGGLPLGQVLPTNPTTKGGLPVLPPTNTKTTPATGPEALPLLSLIPTSVLGYALRKFAAKN